MADAITPPNKTGVTIAIPASAKYRYQTGFGWI
jgi:hypothetical protein